MMRVFIEPVAESLPRLLRASPYAKIAVLVDEHTRRHCYPLIKLLLPKHTLIRIGSGEESKQLATCEQIWQAMTEAGLDRQSLLLNLGGGVIGDMGGFCAATFKRGIDFVQVPTTLLAQVDASVGGKLGIDFRGFKNHLGVFSDPRAVLVDQQFLSTLPLAELRSGFAEIVKHCLIADAAKWEKVRRRDLDKQDWADLIAHSIALKSAVVREDPTEKGRRKILNFGHTLGHAVESFFLATPKRKLRHGEAIAVGMVAESYLAHQKGLLDLASLEQIEEFIFSVFGRVPLTDPELDQIIPLTLQDKKNHDGKVRAALLEGIGQARTDVEISPKEMRQALEYYRGGGVG
ncbi:MAG: 3-dehydroquinate synthase [Ferruginibacter sp.]|nr:3-dehydroquinate synthase [Cytophagales bacterium]